MSRGPKYTPAETAMHWHDDVARHLGTARKLARELGEALGEPDGDGPC